MAALRRTVSGAFRVEDAVTISQVDPSFREKLLPVDTLFPDAAALTLTADQERRCRCGNPFPVTASAGRYRFYSARGEFLALGQIEAGQARSVKSFFEVTP